MNENIKVIEALESEINERKRRLRDHKSIPPEILDLVRFMCETWDAVDDFVYKHCDNLDQLDHYPVVQGTRNQINLKIIGKQKYNPNNLKKAIEWMLSDWRPEAIRLLEEGDKAAAIEHCKKETGMTYGPAKDAVEALKTHKP